MVVFNEKIFLALPSINSCRFSLACLWQAKEILIIKR